MNKNLPWIILNKNNVSNSSKLDLTLNFESGISMVAKIKHDIYHIPFQWVYIYENSNGEYDYIKNEDLNKLKKEVKKIIFPGKLLMKINLKMPSMKISLI